MNKSLKIAAFTAAFLWIGPSFALNDTIGVTAGSGKTANLIKFGSNNVISEVGLCDATTENQCATVSAGGALKVDNSAVTQPVSSTTLATSANLTAGTMKSQIVDGSGNVIASTTNALNVNVNNANANGQATMANSSPVVIASNQSAVPIQGDVASAATNSGNPLQQGGRAQNAEITAVTNGQRVAAAFDLVGKQIVLPYANPENFVSGATAAMTGTTSTSLIAAPASGLRNYLTHLVCTNSHASVGTFILVQDGSGGTTIYEAYAVSAGGGFSLTLPTPLRQPTTATALFVQDVTTGANVICSGSGYKGA